MHEQPLHSDKCTAWCAISGLGVIGPLWFEEDERSVPITKERYIEKIRTFQQALIDRGINLEEQWLMQDGATPHTANLTMTFLNENFNGRLISKRSDFVWAPRSPDLNPLDFFLWGYCKSNVYRSKPKTITELKSEVERFLAEIPLDMCQRVIGNFRKRIDKCIACNGAHFEYKK